MADQRRGASEYDQSKATITPPDAQATNPKPRVRCIGGLHGPREADGPSARANVATARP